VDIRQQQDVRPLASLLGARATLHQILEKRSLLSIQRDMIKLSSIRFIIVPHMLSPHPSSMLRPQKRPCSNQSGCGIVINETTHYHSL
ncbi:MAG: hypothetical protein OXC62_14285, partial [Aestuariivita sp.]|nr:hypothetical protein [Aestuariivita sp.]